MPDTELPGTVSRAVFYSVGSGVAAEAEPALGILGRDGGERRAELDVERIRGWCGLGSQPGLELRPAGFDRVEVGRTGGQVTVGDPGRVQGLSDRLGLVGGEIVHHDNGTRAVAQRRR